MKEIDWEVEAAKPVGGTEKYVPPGEYLAELVGVKFGYDDNRDQITLIFVPSEVENVTLYTTLYFTEKSLSYTSKKLVALGVDLSQLSGQLDTQQIKDIIEQGSLNKTYQLLINDLTNRKTGDLKSSVDQITPTQ